MTGDISVHCVEALVSSQGVKNTSTGVLRAVQHAFDQTGWGPCPDTAPKRMGAMCSHAERFFTCLATRCQVMMLSTFEVLQTTTWSSSLGVRRMHSKCAECFLQRLGLGELATHLPQHLVEELADDGFQVPRVQAPTREICLKFVAIRI